eukprot:473057-Prorocentrum_minimum.AAC.1
MLKSSRTEGTSVVCTKHLTCRYLRQIFRIFALHKPHFKSRVSIRRVFPLKSQQATHPDRAHRKPLQHHGVSENEGALKGTVGGIGVPDLSGLPGLLTDPCVECFPTELSNMYLTKGTGFSLEEREKFKLAGLMPPRVETLDVSAVVGVCSVHTISRSMLDSSQRPCYTSLVPKLLSVPLGQQEQSARAIHHVRSFTKMLNKYIYMENLHSQNIKLFYKVLLDNVVELLPVLYTPTVGEACQKFGSIFRNFAGAVLTESSHIHELNRIYISVEVFSA